MADKETLSTQPSVIHVDHERPETIGSATTHTRNPIRDKWRAKMELPDLEAKAVISACSSGRKLSWKIQESEKMPLIQLVWKAANSFAGDTGKKT